MVLTQDSLHHAQQASPAPTPPGSSRTATLWTRTAATAPTTRLAPPPTKAMATSTARRHSPSSTPRSLLSLADLAPGLEQALPRRRRLAAPAQRLAQAACPSTANVVESGGVEAELVLQGRRARTRMLTTLNVCKFVGLWVGKGGEDRGGREGRI